ncbi:MAG: glycosyltransferase family 2 protein [Patescibacteria group bacterium]
MNLPRIAIIILHYKNLDDTRACLQSVKNINYPLSPLPLGKGETQRGFSIWLVNNDTINHGQILKNEFGDFIFLVQNPKNLGFSEGNNAGIRAALADSQTDAVFILNNDTIVDSNILHEITKSEADMVAPRMMQYHDRGEVDNLGIQLMSSGLPFNRRDIKDKLFCPTGGAALYTRKLLETVGLFDPQFYAYTEDLDLGFRARLMGFKADYMPNAIVYHKGSAATAPMSDFAVYHTYRNLIWAQFKNFPALLLLWQSPWLALGWIFILVLYIKKGRGKIILRALWAGLSGLPAMGKERQKIQRQRKASQKEILSWLSPGLFPRSYLK